MINIIEGMNVLEQTPIKDYTTLSSILMILGISIVIVAIIVFFIKIKLQNRICFKDKVTKKFLFWYILGLSIILFSVIQFP